jgi:hypothetical protein
LLARAFHAEYHALESNMLMEFTNSTLITGGIVLALVAVVALAIFVELRRKKSSALRAKFGSEYDRAVVTHGSQGKAEAKLADRASRVDKLNIRELGATERERYLADWQTVQSRFVDHPKGAVTEADELITSLLQARGYPVGEFEQRAADVSVDYPRVMENYRAAQAIAVRTGKPDATTEELRTAMIHYRGIFDELIQVRELAAAKSAA